MKLGASASAQTVVLNGVSKVEYEAEFATQVNVSTNTDHAGYTGTGFVDGFETAGDSVTFEVSAKTSGTYTIGIRYSSAGGNASRAIYVNNVKVTDLALPQTANWETWATATLNVTLNAGANTIKVSYDGTSSLGVNLDHITVS